MYMADLAPQAVKTQLPSSGTKLEVPIHDTEGMVRDLLTDPRIKDEDYLFFNDDPLQDPPPDSEWMEVRDLSTGKSFRKTHEEDIAPEPYTKCGRKKVLCPVVPYMDGCTTGAFMNLSLEIVKFTLGIFNNKARNKECCWRNMGAVPKYVEAKSAAKESIRQSTHTAATDYLTDSDADEDDDSLGSAFCVTQMDCGAYLPFSDDESSDDGSEWGWEDEAGCDEAEMSDEQAAFAYEKYLFGEEKAALRETDKAMKLIAATSMPENRAQDLHSILHIILAKYKRIQEEGGIEWDLFYKGKLYRLLFIPFVVFVKGDSVEQDKHVGKYGSRTKGVAHLCRHCHCPNEETDDAYADHARKTQTEITTMVKSRDTKGLKAISQQMLWNAWYELKFGKHNDEGVHGATPLEILHWIQLGQFGYSRENLFKQTGSGKLGRDVNKCATEMGWLFQRQSDKALPRTKFTNGVMKGKLMAHEHTGLMLNLAATIRSAQGRKILTTGCNTTKQGDFFPDAKWVNDWLLLLETQLQLEQWLRQDCLKVDEVERLKVKAREYMDLSKTVGKREQGMGCKTMNFHGILHVHDDILNFGVPKNVDTASNEMHHKRDKKSASRTQKRPKSFELQALHAIEDRCVIDMGKMELEGVKRWDYFKAKEQHETDDLATTGSVQPVLSGVKAEFSWSVPKDAWIYKLFTTMKGVRKFKFSPTVKAFIQEVGVEVSKYMETVPIYSELHMPDKQMYRAASYYKGKTWFDWAMFKYADADGEIQVLPAQLRCFVDLRGIPTHHTGKYKPAIYMIVETVCRNEGATEVSIPSEIFVPYLKNKMRVTGTTKWTAGMKILPLDTLIGPICVIPDLHNSHENAFLMVKPMTAWADQFSMWLNEDHTKEFGDGQARRGDKPKEGDKPEEGVKLAEQAQLLQTIPEGSIVAI